MNEEPTTVIIQRYLDALPGDAAAELLARELLERAAGRLRLLCGTLLHKSYPRLTRPPANLETDELLGDVVAGLLTAMRKTRPPTVRRFFALANQHMRWQLNDLAGRLDKQPGVGALAESCVAALPASAASGLSPDGAAHPGGDRRPPRGRARGLRAGRYPGADACRGGDGGRSFPEDRAAAPERGPAAAGGAAGGPSPGLRRPADTPPT